MPKRFKLPAVIQKKNKLNKEEFETILGFRVGSVKYARIKCLRKKGYPRQYVHCFSFRPCKNSKDQGILIMGGKMTKAVNLSL